MGQVITSFVARRAEQLESRAPEAKPAAHEGYAYAYPEVAYGSKYAATKDMDLRDIAKLVRADLKTIVKRGFKLSVRIDRYSMGQSLDVRVVAVPASFRVLNAERFALEQRDPHGYHGGLPWISDEAKALREEIEAIVRAYNYDGSDTMTDYYHVRFHSTVDFDSNVTRAERAARVAGIIE